MTSTRQAVHINAEEPITHTKSRIRQKHARLQMEPPYLKE